MSACICIYVSEHPRDKRPGMQSEFVSVSTRLCESSEAMSARTCMYHAQAYAHTRTHTSSSRSIVRTRAQALPVSLILDSKLG